jgi:PTH1 family peptidyl-tRNA hydrolase
MRIIVGLGNPGEKYTNSRHNAGWIFLDNLISNPNWQENKKFKALIHKEVDKLYVKPLTFMNNSGESVRKIMDFYGLLPRSLGIIAKKNQDLSDTLTVIHDELDLDFGKEKNSKDSGSAGHKGVASIINHLKTKNFTRLRLGIKNELLKNKIPTENFVLQNFSKEELNDLIDKAKYYKQKELF